MKCKKCGASLIENNNFCTNCGERVTNELDNNTSNHKNKKSNIVSIIILVFIPIIVGLILGAILFNLSRNGFSSKSNNKIDNETREKALSYWDKYSESIKEEKGTSLGLDGGWKSIDSDVYYVFKNNEFWFYQSYNDLSNNYWYGTIETSIGIDSLKKLGMEDSKVLEMYNAYKEYVDDVYVIVINPVKIVNNGESEADPDSSSMIIFSVIDHKEKGIEGRLINLSNLEHTESIYYKLND